MIELTRRVKVDLSMVVIFILTNVIGRSSFRIIPEACGYGRCKHPRKQVRITLRTHSAFAFAF